MIFIDSSETSTPVALAKNNGSRDVASEDRFIVDIADELLRTTRQYGRWSQIRQNDPARAEKIARLVAERHEFVSGRVSPSEEGRSRFDELTSLLKKEGIHLYGSDEFDDPIFPTASRNEKNELSMASSTNSYLPKDADSAVVPELRQEFARKDCYEFLAGMLEKKGISYYGKEGVAGELIQKARTEGKDPYAYFTGEGVTGVLCSQPVSIEVPRAKGTSVEDVWNQLEPHLKEGAILSYSSKTFGHTGIVRQKAGEWMYVNSSGVLGKPSSYKVVQEDLKSEIKGWLRRAEKRNTAITITIGAVDGGRAAEFSKSPLLLSQALKSSEVNLMA